jgi:hypothetical protein
MSTLHITNGDSTVELLKAAHVKGDMLPWRDVLHMGPVPSGHTLQALSLIRASFLASLSWGNEDVLIKDFQQRDTVLEGAEHYDHILLWFEHDLYDQLQLLQLLDWFNHQTPILTKLALINPDKHLGYHTVEEVPDLLAQKRAVSQPQLTIATDVWHAFTQSTPEKLSQCLQHDLSTLPHLKDALLRTLAELPSPETGLNQTEESIFKLLDSSSDEKGMTSVDIFRAYNSQEKAAFHGDMGFFWYLEQLSKDAPELIKKNGDRFTLTPQGRKVLSVPTFWQRDYQAQQWLGGYAFGREQIYYWDPKKQRLSHGKC